MRKILLKDISQIPILYQQNFQMVHCDKEAIYLSQTNLNRGCLVGAGAVILNRRDQMLLVQEKNGIMREKWGFPSGLVEKGESIVQGMQREVKEETNLDVLFRDILLIRKIEFTKWELSDIYFGMLAFLETDQEVTYCPKELMGYQWVNREDIFQFYKSKDFTAISQFCMTQLQLIHDKGIDLRTLQKFQIKHTEQMNIYIPKQICK